MLQFAVTDLPYDREGRPPSPAHDLWAVLISGTKKLERPIPRNAREIRFRFLPKAAAIGFGRSISTNSQFLRQRLPFAINNGFGFEIHQNLIRPGSVEALTCPFARGIDAHFRSVVRQARGVVQ